MIKTKNTNLKLLFEFLKKTELIKRNRVNVSLIEILSRRDIYKTVDLLLHLTETQQLQIAQNTFAHSASQSLAGRWNCTFLPHRLLQLNELANFAALYSDCVHVENFFLDYEHFDDLNMLREMLHDDLWMLIAMKPLLDADRLKFYTPEMHSCLHCFETVFGEDTQRRIEKGHKVLTKEYFENSSVSLIKYNRHEIKFELNGPEPFYKHPMVMIFPARGRIRHVVSGKPKLLRALKDTGSASLSQSLSRNLQLHRKFSGIITNSATFGILSSAILKTSFLTDNPLDISFLKTISDRPQLDKRNQLALKHLSSIVPFVGDVRVPDLLKLRNREEEAFLNYRKALNEAITEFKSADSDFTEKQAREIYSDLIEPRLASLDKRVKVAKKDLLKKSIRSIVAVAGVISFGLYSGFISGETAELIKTLGLAKIAYDVVEKSIPIGEARSAIKSDDLYFLWKAKKLAKKGSR